MLDRVEADTREQTQVCQSKEREWPAIDDEVKWNASNGWCQQVDRRQQHETFVNVQLAAEVKSQSDQH